MIQVLLGIPRICPEMFFPKTTELLIIMVCEVTLFGDIFYELPSEKFGIKLQDDFLHPNVHWKRLKFVQRKQQDTVRDFRSNTRQPS